MSARFDNITVKDGQLIGLELEPWKDILRKAKRGWLLISSEDYQELYRSIMSMRHGLPFFGSSGLKHFVGKVDKNGRITLSETDAPRYEQISTYAVTYGPILEMWVRHDFPPGTVEIQWAGVGQP
jgi:hypothetical protein